MDLRGALHSFCDAILAGCPDQNDTTERVRGFLANMDQDPRLDALVREYLTVPNHVFACMELNYRGFSDTTPLAVCQGQYSLPIHQALEIFSRTSALRFAGVWVPLLQVAQCCITDPSHLQRLGEAMQHLQQQQVDTNAAAAGQMEFVLQNMCQSFPGLQGMVQQVMQMSGDPDSPGGLTRLLSQVETLLQPLLTQAAANASAQNPSLQPALGQILSGFAQLTNTLQQQQQQPASMES